MAEYLIQDTTLTSIANEIRTLSGIDDTLSPIEMKSKVNAVNEEIDIQTDLITQISSALDGKINIYNLEIAKGSFILTEDTTSTTYRHPHHLGHIPDFFIIFTEEGQEEAEFLNCLKVYMHMHIPLTIKGAPYNGVAFSYYYNGESFVNTTTKLGNIACTEDELYIYLNTRKLKANVEYKWVCGTY